MIDEACGVTAPPPTTPVLWAVLDTLDNCWMGSNSDNTGPKLYEAETVAQFAAEMGRRLLGFTPGRLAARPFSSSGKQLDEAVFVRDTIEVFDELERDGSLTDDVVRALVNIEERA